MTLVLQAYINNTWFHLPSFEIASGNHVEENELRTRLYHDRMSYTAPFCVLIRRL